MALFYKRHTAEFSCTNAQDAVLNERLPALLQRPNSEHTGVFPQLSEPMQWTSASSIRATYNLINSVRKWNERLHSCYFHYNFITVNTNPELKTVFQKQRHLQVQKQKNNLLKVHINQKHPKCSVYEKKECTFSQSFKPGNDKSALFPTNLSLQGREGKLVLEQDIPLSEATTLSFDHLTPRVPNSCEEEINSTTIK